MPNTHHADDFDLANTRSANDFTLDMNGTNRPMGEFDRPASYGACDNSFSADTLVATPDGDVPISEIEIGDTVLAYNESTGEVGEYTVTATINHVDETIVYLLIDDELIITTPEHPFYTDGGDWRRADELERGDQIFSADGDWGIIESIQIIDHTQRMYNLTVDTAHTFFVGDGQWLVHNTWCVGDPLDAPDSRGNPPSWATIQSRYWKTEAAMRAESGDYSEYNLEKMREGKAPTALVEVTDLDTGERQFRQVRIELHHWQGRGSGRGDPLMSNLDNLVPLWPWEHAFFDHYRARTLPYRFERFIKDASRYE